MTPAPIVDRENLTVTALKGWAFESGTLHERVCLDAADLSEAVADFSEYGEPCTDSGCDWCADV